jgi:hypothetical protein
MPLQPAVPSPMHEAQVRQHLRTLARGAAHQQNALAGSSPDALDIEAPHPVYVLGLDQVLAGAELAKAVPVGWRSLLRQGDGQVVAAAQTVTDAGGQAAFASFNSGPYVASTSQALDTATEYADGDAGGGEAWEPRVLHVPALHAMGRWLHTETETTDGVLPLPPVPPGNDADHRYTVPEYLAALQGLAGTVQPTTASDTTGG